MTFLRNGEQDKSTVGFLSRDWIDFNLPILTIIPIRCWVKYERENKRERESENL